MDTRKTGDGDVRRSMIDLTHTAVPRLVSDGRITRCEAGWSWAPPPLADFDFWIVLAGAGQLTLGRDTHRLTAGSAFLLKPGDRVRAAQHPDDRLTVFYQHFMLLDADGVMIEVRGVAWPPNPVMLRDVASVEFHARVIGEGMALGNPLGLRRAELACWQLMLQLELEAAGGEGGASDPRIERVLLAIRREPGEAWSGERMARLAGLSRTQFARLFTRTTGLPPNRYVTRLRIDRARTLLAETDMPLAVIAESLGYRDEYFFNRQFRQWTGAPPGMMRRRTRHAVDTRAKRGAS